MFTKRILVVDNDLDVCSSIQKYMQTDDTEVKCTTSISGAINNLVEQDYCLVMLSGQLSGISNMEMLQRVHLVKHVPILVLTIPLDTDEKIALFHAGADAIIEKPLNIALCAAQAEALIQIYTRKDVSHRQKNQIIYGTELIIQPYCRLAFVDGKSLSLTRKEFDLLCHFSRNPGRVFNREQLYARIWDDNFVDSGDETVRVHIQTLRKKLEAEGKHYIHNVWGVGYKFVPPECT